MGSVAFIFCINFPTFNFVGGIAHPTESPILLNNQRIGAGAKPDEKSA